MHQARKPRSALPYALSARDIGGATTAQQDRKTNFLHQGLPFLIGLADKFGMEKVQANTEPGDRRSSGIARARCGEVALSLQEKEHGAGVVFSMSVGTDSPVEIHSEPIGGLTDVDAFDDFVFRMSKKLKSAGS